MRLYILALDLQERSGVGKSSVAPWKAFCAQSKAEYEAMMEPTNILVVDDCPIVRGILGGILEDAGYAVHLAESGCDALAALEQEAFSLVLLDVEMEGLNGLEILELLRRDSEFENLPILIISASTGCSEMVRALDLGANDYLTKPVAAPLLLAKIRRNLPATQPKLMAPSFSVDAVLPVGTQLGHYEIASLIGEGAGGRVYRARDVRLLRMVAVKVPRDFGPDDPEQFQLFRTEALAAARISHPNVVSIYDVGGEPVPFIAMELVEGYSPVDPIWNLPVPAHTAVLWTRQVLSGLAAAHAQGIIHRDLKPENILIMPNGLLKLMDFGVAKLKGHQDVYSDTTVGTPAHMAPEQVDRSFGEVDARTDLFAVAGMLYTTLTGASPFPAKHPAQQLFSIVTTEPRPLRQLNDEVPPRLEAVCLRGLRKQPSERYQTASEFSTALQRSIE